jgi:hypothetical protein
MPPAKILCAAAVLAVLPATAWAQDRASPAPTTNNARSQPKEDQGFPWGVLGLIGLAGLGYQKKARDIHVDARSKTRN